MPTNYSQGRTTFGLLPEPEGRSARFIASSIINVTILGVVLLVGMTAKQVIEPHYVMTELIVPTTPPPEIKVKTPLPPELPPPPEQPKLELRLQPKQIVIPKPVVEPKPVQIEYKVNTLVVQPKQQVVTLAPQPKAALTASMTAQNNQVKAFTAPVHLGDTFGATPNPNATRPATIAAIGSPYGGMRGPAVAPHGVVGSTGIGNGLKVGSFAGVVGKVASAGIPGAASTDQATSYGKVGSTGIVTVTTVAAAQGPVSAPVQATEVEVLSKPAMQYPAEAKKLHLQGDVVLSVTFLASGQVVVNGVLQGLGHGLDEEARRIAQQIRFRPATSFGRAVDVTTKIRITFQLA